MSEFQQSCINDCAYMDDHVRMIKPASFENVVKYTYKCFDYIDNLILNILFYKHDDDAEDRRDLWLIDLTRLKTLVEHELVIDDNTNFVSLIISELNEHKLHDYKIACKEIFKVGRRKTAEEKNWIKKGWLVYKSPEFHLSIWTSVKFLAILESDFDDIGYEELIDQAIFRFEENALISSDKSLVNVTNSKFKAFTSDESINE